MDDSSQSHDPVTSTADLREPREYHDPATSTDASRARHRRRYQTASEMLLAVDLPSHGPILDAGCGTGYGTQILADSWLSRNVIGVDSNHKAISKALTRRNWQQLVPEYWYESLVFSPRTTPNFHRAAPFAAIVCIEVLEHLDMSAQRAWVESAHDLLHPGGAFLVMCPVKQPGSVLSGPNPANKYHVHEPTVEELDAVLGLHFDEIRTEPIEPYHSTSGDAWQATRLAVKAV